MKHITIVGAGALGSHLALFLRNVDCQLTIIDHDRVETKNIQSQFHTRMGLAKVKVSAMKAAFQGMFGVKLEIRPTKLVKENVEVLLAGTDLVVDCTDNIQARDLIQRYCIKHWKQCLHCCLSADGGFGRVVWTEQFCPDAEPGFGEETREDGINLWTEHFDQDAEPAFGKETCEDGRNLPFYVQAAALAAQVIMLHLDKDIRQCWQITPFSVVKLV